MIYQILDGQTVVNTITADLAFMEAQYPAGNYREVIQPEPIPVVVVPQQVTMRQAELALLEAGLLDDIEALIPTLSREDQINWKRASVVQRSNPLVAYVQQTKGLTDAEIDALFTRAATL